MKAERCSRSKLFASLPPVWPESLLPRILATAASRPEQRTVVIDDDPVGAQTLVGSAEIPLLTEWTDEILRDELAESWSSLVLLLGSRRATREEARAIVRAACLNLSTAASGRALSLISRWHPSLQGHFPLETDIIREFFGPFNATILIPPFGEGCRVTVNDIHYAARGGELVPAAEAALATGNAVGYRTSNLREWVEERTEGRVKAAAVGSIPLDLLRREGPTAVERLLLDQPPGTVCVLNAATARDVEVFVVALQAAEAQGRRFLMHATSQFDLLRAGLRPRPFLAKAELECGQQPIRTPLPGPVSSRDYRPPPTLRPALAPHRKMTIPPELHQRDASPYLARPASLAGGLVVVGSRGPRAMAQLRHLLSRGAVLPLEMGLPKLLSSRRDEVIERTRSALSAALLAGQDAVLFTSGRLPCGESLETIRQIEGRIAAALVELVRQIEVRPRYVLAEGIATASDVARNAL